MDFWFSNLSSFLSMNLVAFLPLLAVNGFAFVYATSLYRKCPKAAHLIYLGSLFDISQVFTSWAMMHLPVRNTSIRPYYQYFYYLQAIPSWVAYGLWIAAALAGRSQHDRLTRTANQDSQNHYPQEP